MTSAIFVSDIHIQSPDCPRGRLFLKLLRSLSGESNVTHLFLLGDIFDLWVADHSYFVNRYSEIIDAIRRLKSENVEIVYFEGNHDLHLRNFWEDQLGLTVAANPRFFELSGRQLRIEHGDQMDPDDTGYRFLRWFLRTPPVRWLICNLPDRVVVRIGEKASVSSREYTTHTKSIAPDHAVMKIRAHAARAYSDRPFDLILSGHVHVRDDYRIDVAEQTFRSVNLGSWMDAPCYFKLDDNEERFYELSGE
jgi:UDP-2,3-diacylglucosamine hydrolase